MSVYGLERHRCMLEIGDSEKYQETLTKIFDALQELDEHMIGNGWPLEVARSCTTSMVLKAIKLDRPSI